MTPVAPKYPISIAPMMDWTTRHYRFFMRQLTKKTLLYTEMITTGAILHGDSERLLSYSPEEHPISLQLGGDNPEDLAKCTKIAQDYGYDEININVGCPSDRVQRGSFGACLMARPELVADCVTAMKSAVDIPVTVKHRIGIDDLDRYEDMYNFVDIVSKSGADRFTVHARKAWLQGLSPKQNRTVPPLRYDDVYKLKQAFPELEIEINGGIATWEQCDEHLKQVDAAMLGRAAYENPYLFATADQHFFGSSDPVLSRHEAVEAMYPYMERWLERDLYLNHITRHMLNLFKGQPGGKFWRRHISENINKAGAGIEVVEAALAGVPEVRPELEPKLAISTD